MSTLSYATWPHPDQEQSRAALAVGTDVETFAIRGRGLHLEAKTLIRGLGRSHSNGIRLEAAVVTAELHELLTHPDSATDQLRRLVDQIAKFLDHHPVPLRIGEQPAQLRQLLAQEAPSQAPTGVPDEDVTWAAAHGATIVYTDASTESSKYLGAWAWYVEETRYAAGPVPHLTSAFGAERHAILEALEALTGPLLVVTDAWDVLIGQDVFARTQGVDDTRLERAIAARGEEIRFVYVKGHRSCLGNVAADQLAQTERANLVARTAETRSAEHAAELAELMAATADYRAAQQVKHAWFTNRSREIIVAEYPNWSDLPAETRTQLGREMTLRMRTEYNDLHGTTDQDTPEQ